jgi:hypothetical protein
MIYYIYAAYPIDWKHNANFIAKWKYLDPSIRICANDLKYGDIVLWENNEYEIWHNIEIL